MSGVELTAEDQAILGRLSVDQRILYDASDFADWCTTRARLQWGRVREFVPADAGRHDRLCDLRIAMELRYCAKELARRRAVQS